MMARNVCGATPLSNTYSFVNPNLAAIDLSVESKDCVLVVKTSIEKEGFYTN